MTIEAMTPASKNHFDTLSIRIKDLAVQRMNGRKFVFLENGEVTVHWKSHRGNEISRGEWKQDPEREKIFISINNDVSVFDYKFLSSSILIMRMERKEGLFDNLCLEKIN